MKTTTPITCLPFGGPPVSRRATERQEFTVSRDRVDLWLVLLPTGPGAAAPDLKELDAAERLRVTTFTHPADALLYVTAHVALRRLLGRYTATPPEELRFRREPCPGCGAAHGRPALAQRPAPLHFSLSHSGEIALVGVGAVPLGVDVELLAGEETVAACSQTLHLRERSELAEVEGEEARRRLFGRIWTRKEAFLKGLGTGLSRSPALDYLGADAGRHPGGWTILDIPVGPAHTAAVAVRGPAPSTVELHQFPASWLSGSDCVA